MIWKITEKLYLLLTSTFLLLYDIHLNGYSYPELAEGQALWSPATGSLKEDSRIWLSKSRYSMDIQHDAKEFHIHRRAMVLTW